MITEIWQIGNDIRTLGPELETLNTLHRFRLANLLEHIGHVLKDTHYQLGTGCDPRYQKQLPLLSEELYFKLASLLGEVEAGSLAGHFRSMQPGQLLPSRTYEAHELALLEEAAGHFLETSKRIRLN
jgi:hypothetical protein